MGIFVAERAKAGRGAHFDAAHAANPQGKSPDVSTAKRCYEPAGRGAAAISRRPPDPALITIP